MPTAANAGYYAAIVAEQALDLLEAPILRVGAMDVPIPQNAALEALVLPSALDIEQAVRSQLA